MYYIPSAPVLKATQKPSLLRVYSYGAFLCDRTLSLLNQSTPTSYLADVPPRLMVATLPDSDRCISQLLVSVECFDKSLDTSECRLNSSTDGGGLLDPLPSWGNLCIKSGDDSLLVRMGLVPSISQDSVAGGTTSDEDLEIEVFRNTSFDATEWHEASLQTQDEGFQDTIDSGAPFSELCLDTQTWPSSCVFSFSKHLSLIPQMLQGDSSLLASSSSFFGDIQASSSSSNTFDKNLPGTASSNDVVDDSQIRRKQLTDTQDIDYDISLEFSPIALDGQFSFELDFPLLPSPSGAAVFAAEGFALSEVAQPELISQNIKISFDAEEFSSSSSHTSVLSSAPIVSAQSFILPTFASMENLIHISLDIPDLSSGSSFPSISSLCQLSPCASGEDLVRIQLPTWCEAEDDEDAFEPLPPSTVSPFCLPSRLGFSKNFVGVEYTCPSLPSVKEEDS